MEKTAEIHSTIRNANFISKLLFWWTVPLIRLGYRRELRQNDIHGPDEGELTENLGGRIAQLWNQELLQKPNPSLLQALIRMFGLEYSIIFILILIQQCVLRTCVPVLLGLLIRFASGYYLQETGNALAVVLIALTFLNSIMFQQANFLIIAMAMRVRVSLISLTYAKTLRLSQASVAATGVGQLTNIISNDVNRFDRCLMWTPYAIACPIQLLVMGSILWIYTGPASLAGFAFFVLMIPLSGVFGRCVGAIRVKVAAATDTRVRLVTEILNGMLLLKMCTFEKPYSDKMNEARSVECKAIQKKNSVLAFTFSVSQVIPKLSIALTFLTCVLMDSPITTESVFVTLSMYTVVQTTAGFYFPQSISGISEIMVSIRRIQKVLLMDEQTNGLNNMISYGSTTKSKLEPRVTLRNVVARWPKIETVVLSGVSLKVSSGQLLGVIGPVGSGKSTLLQVILNEVSTESEGVSVVGRVAYASQEPCFFAGSVKDNILFGLPFDPAWYDLVLEACALNQDLCTLAYGDESLIGDKGLNLSGGQKARIGLARAVYSMADVYLLDDPLSAVDVRVARHLMEKCIRGLLRDKCVILVTHQTHYLKEGATEIIALEKGTISRRGTYEEVCRCTADSEADTDFPMTVDDIVLENEVSPPSLSANDSGQTLLKGYGTFEKQKAVAEGQATGLVGWKLYADYLRIGNSCMFLSIVGLISGITQIFLSGSDLWLQKWTNYEEVWSPLKVRKTDDNSKWYILVYVVFVIGIFIFSALRAFGIFRIFLKSSMALYAQLFSAIMRAPMRFFEVNSVGRILNRLSNDMGIMDEYLPQLFYIVINTYLLCIGSLVLIVLMSPILAVPTVIQLLLFYILQHIYATASPRIKRLEGTARSPVFAQLSTTLTGISVIRAFGAKDMFVRQFNNYQDTHTSNYYAYISALSWFQNAVELIADLYISSIVLYFVLVPSNPSALGLAISTTFLFSQNIRVALSQSTEVGNQIVAVERAIEYTDVKPEAPLRIPGLFLGGSWVKQSEIRMDQVTVAYENGIKVLQNISLGIGAGEKIGIVGRTGAGKSSLIACLFRIVEPQSGSMHISNIDISRIGLHDLRPQLSIIPQNPVLFSGSLRYNLDPFNEYTDSELWNALEVVQLEPRIRQSSGQNLNLIISDGGSNFSHGEKQLICLARTIVRKSRILILDEATANIDTKTDGIIQETLRRRFQDSTILTIAHRLDTVMDSDRVLVLDSGQIKDFDAPWKLLNDSSSLLYKLVSNTGSTNSEKLRRAAMQAHFHRQAEKASKCTN